VVVFRSRCIRSAALVSAMPGKRGRLLDEPDAAGSSPWAEMSIDLGG
jgi:hypothetical protein